MVLCENVIKLQKKPSKMTSLPDLEQKSISKRSLTVLGILKEIVIVLSTANTVIFIIQTDNSKLLH